jgi:hypothetical protein
VPARQRAAGTFGCGAVAWSVHTWIAEAHQERDAL